ncbi:hypothetical protein CHLNCDRAFT_137639 [Chlorella variabilis]|uniref:Uncharacterized protein n=1 Tax=Chlorella variabilis TaxID=554065 RepID=E1Z457_CHLVA|nr:hypothetical protein CHLNCDRAFT_137639 [Chlorella variabilis]EFN58996.1 hypothetical protein CHLNCDRAFT_137639 [Chlorella variabilis]|eukprot:XP_005851098.1 hypothetical protein CHLNCDRAFT_137639 [Chlorella variabilis]
MRITVTVDVAPEEVPMATELLAVLRQLTDHVSVNMANGGVTPASQQGPAPAAPPPLPTAPGSARVSPEPGQQQAASRGPSPINSAAAPPGPLTPASSTQSATSTAAAAAPPPPAPAIQFPPGTPPQQQMHALIAQSEYTEHPEALARQLEALLSDPSLGGPAAMFPEFCTIWTSVALNPNLPAEERSAVPFVMLLQSMGPGFREKFRDYIMRLLLTHLTKPRPVNANRGEYYVHAEAFAALVSIEIVPIDGAIQTMCTLARNPEKRGAAVTMLGKTVELAGHVIAEKVPAATQEAMRATVANITNAEFRYDVEYINSTMGWTQGAAAPAAVAAAGPAAAPSAAPAGPRSLRPVRSIPGAHNEMIFAMAVDSAHQQFVTGGKDMYLQVWTQDGSPVQKLELGDQYISSMDFHPRLNMLLCSCLNQATQSLRLGGFTSGQPNGFAAKGFVAKDDMMAVATVRALPESTGFLTGETVFLDRAQAPLIRYWDVAAAASFQSLQPTQTFKGHAQIATALRGVAGDANMFVSGDKGGAMLLWDLRSPTHVGTFGAPDPAGHSMAHNLMVTSIESAGPLVISGSTDKSVALWDIRTLGQPPLAKVGADNMTVLKLALNAGRKTVVVSAVHTLRLLDITNPTAPVLSEPVVASWPDGRPRNTYHDVKWNEALGSPSGLDIEPP